MSIKFSNFGKAIISAAPSGATGLSFSVEAGKGALFPVLGTGDYFYGIFKDASGNNEVVKVTARSTDTMTIATGGRGLDGTAARSWAAGDYFVAAITNAALSESVANPTLSAIGGLETAANKLPYFTGVSQVATADITDFARTLLDDPDAVTMRNTLGAAGQAFPAGTSMIFFNASAPVGWTHVTGGIDHALRVVSGGGVGGTYGGSGNTFTNAFKSHSVTGTVGTTTLTTAQMPWHTHAVSSARKGTASGFDGGYFLHTLDGLNATTQGSGGGGGHNHSFSGTAINLSVFYLNVIVATKN
jgi:hypothetical protein